jgi:hypothetical protein
MDVISVFHQLTNWNNLQHQLTNRQTLPADWHADPHCKKMFEANPNRNLPFTTGKAGQV